jgi:hypothetical protein
VVKLTNKHTASLEFQHAGQLVKLPVGEAVECSPELWAELVKYETIQGYLLSGLVLAEQPAPAVEPKKSRK